MKKLLKITAILFFATLSIYNFTLSQGKNNSFVKLSLSTTPAFASGSAYEVKDQEKGHVKHTIYTGGELCVEEYDYTEIDCLGSGSVACVPNFYRDNYKLDCVPMPGNE